MNKQRTKKQENKNKMKNTSSEATPVQYQDKIELFNFFHNTLIH